MKQPVYTKKPPTKPGLYWYRVWPSRVNRYCRVWEDYRGELVASTNGEPKQVALFGRQWAGPLLEPLGEEGR